MLLLMLQCSAVSWECGRRRSLWKMSIVWLRRMVIVSVSSSSSLDWFQSQFSSDACAVSSGAEWSRSVHPTERSHQETTRRTERKIHKTPTGKASPYSPPHTRVIRFLDCLRQSWNGTKCPLSLSGPFRDNAMSRNEFF